MKEEPGEFCEIEIKSEPPDEFTESIQDIEKAFVGEKGIKLEINDEDTRKNIYIDAPSTSRTNETEKDPLEGTSGFGVVKTEKADEDEMDESEVSVPENKSEAENGETSSKTKADDNGEFFSFFFNIY